ncbi:hypothetical protein [Thalassospira marina]|uniref:Uncharacterized protein n=1 Tax=Thalassospira marina TaxID=2048283 RepID=A0A2N3KX36_9PROT|nr:hypothetical protein [Thalassospira marina]PKR55036.1 hypothetical protein COO20_06525 [Thalassospira marina]
MITGKELDLFKTLLPTGALSSASFIISGKNFIFSGENVIFCGTGEGKWQARRGYRNYQKLNKINI